jgi:predicted methyltransferase
MRQKKLAAFVLGLCVTAAQAATVEQAMNKPGRLPADIARDAHSHPEAVIPLLQLQSGDRVADIWAGSGYYSELLGSVVGEEGEVLLINNAAYQQFAAKSLAERFEGRQLTGVTVHQAEAEDLGLGEQQLNAAVIIMSYHDIYHVDDKNGWRAIDQAGFLRQIFTGLKPGGRFLIVDHVAESGSGSRDAQELHRIDPEFARSDIESYGFVFEASSDVLRNPDDDHSLMVFDPAIRGKTDRFLLVFRKPG